MEQKLNEMLKQKIIEEVNEPCRWVSPMVIVPKANGDIRICIDKTRQDIRNHRRKPVRFGRNLNTEKRKR